MTQVDKKTSFFTFPNASRYGKRNGKVNLFLYLLPKEIFGRFRGNKKTFPLFTSPVSHSLILFRYFKNPYSKRIKLFFHSFRALYYFYCYLYSFFSFFKKERAEPKHTAFTENSTITERNESNENYF